MQNEIIRFDLSLKTRFAGASSEKNKINKENRSQFHELCHLGTMNFVLKYDLKWDSRQVKGPLNNWICHKVQFYFYLLVPQKYKTQFQIVRLTWTIKILLTTARVNSVAVKSRWCFKYVYSEDKGMVPRQQVLNISMVACKSSVQHTTLTTTDITWVTIKMFRSF